MIKRHAEHLLRNSKLFQGHSGHETVLNPLVKLWIFRLLVPLGGLRDFVHRHSFKDEELAAILGLGKWIGTDENDNEVEFVQKKVIRDLRRVYREVEEECREAILPENFTLNIERVAKLVGLSEVDCRILEFAVLLHIETQLNEIGDCLGNLSSIKIIQVISVVLDIAENEVRDALNPQSILARSGLVWVDRNGADYLTRKTEILSHTFADTLFSSDADPIHLLRDTVSISSQPNIGIDDYGHIKKELIILLPYIKHCLAQKKKGVNILLYGRPGTGKTQLTKVIAQLNECELFEISSEDSEGDAIEGKQRLSAYSAAQCFFSSKRSLLVFDEAEDIFANGDGFFSRPSIAQTRKAWMNKALEENTVPTFWLSNSIRGIDPAFVRRFDMAIEMPLPPELQKKAILQKQCGDFIDASTIKRLAECEFLAPAVMEKTSGVMREIKDELNSEQLAESLLLLVNATLKSQGHNPLPKASANKLPEVYNEAFINADKNLAEVSAGLAEVKSGRLCLYGPPGTGKTAYGRWLAEKLDIPLLVKRASDLMDMYVGGTEKNMAEAFYQAEHENAILLIDEVDSFLRDRRGATKSWEVTAVNEMLTQMESFSGIFIASTNLMEGLDQASLRRFDLKVKFDFLLPQQAWELCLRYCQQLAIPEPDSYLKHKLECLPNLTPGDYAAVARQHRFRPIKTTADFVMALEGECALKERSNSKGIGFLAH